MTFNRNKYIAMEEGFKQVVEEQGRSVGTHSSATAILLKEVLAENTPAAKKRLPPQKRQELY